MNRTSTENRYIQILSAGVRLEGILSIPEHPKGIILFVHGSGSSRHSPRNQYVAQTLQEAGLATLLFDLLTPHEEEIDQHTQHICFDINLLAHRTVGVVEWLDLEPYARELKIGLFGSSTGAAAALIAAAELPEKVEAVVSRGGRPDLADGALRKVRAPTLLLVGGNDEIVVELNQEALDHMQPGADKKMVVVPGASHLFDEPGTLEYAARLAREWFVEHLDQVRVK